VTVAHPSESRLLRTDHVFVGSRKVGDPTSFWDDSDRTLATVRGTQHRDFLVDEVVHHPCEEWNVLDGGVTVFELRRYDPGDHPSYVVMGDDDEPLGTYFCEGSALHNQFVVRDEAAAPVANMRTRHHLHELRDLHGPGLACCRRVLDRYGDDPLQEVWELRIESDDDLLDRRVVLAAPLVSALSSHAKRHIDASCSIAGVLLVAFPPAGLGLLAVEECLDGWYWLRRKLE
jgi:hypothetical protein